MREKELLQEQIHLLQTILDAIPVAVYYKDCNGIYLGCNKAFEVLRGIHREDIVGCSPFDANPLQTAYFHKQIDDTLLESAEFQTQYEKQLVMPDGSTKDIIYEKSVFTNTQGERIGIVGIMLDNTERKKQALELEESKQRYKRLVEVSPFATLLHQNGKIEFVNNAAIKMLHGCAREDFIDHNYFDFVHPKFRAMETLRIEEMSKERGHEMPMVESKFMTYDGEIIDVETAAVSFERDNGQMCFQVVFHDISERKEAEKALSKNRKFLSTTLHSIGDGVISTNNEGIVVGVNAAAETMLGFTEQEMISNPLKNFVKFLHHNSKKEIPSPVDLVLSTGAIVAPRNNTLYVTSIGKEIPIKHNASPIVDEYGDMTGVVMVFRDVTEEYQYQERLVSSERLAAVGLMASGIAHEFNNINAVVKGHVDLICREPLSDKVRKSLDIVKSALNQGSDITSDLLAFTNTTANKEGMKAVSPSALINHVLEMMNVNFEKAGIKTQVIEKTTEKMYVNPKNIAHVFMNLFINAEHALTKSSDKRIIVTIEEPENDTDVLHEDTIIIKIQDTGCGIPRDNLAKIFMPFFSTKGNYAEKNSWQAQLKGTGLGLSVCHSIVVGQHKGEIVVDSDPDKGTTFTLYLSKYIDQSQTGFVDLKYEKGTGQRVLLFGEDSEANQMISEVISGEGYKVFTTDILSIATNENQGEPFDVVVIGTKICKNADLARNLCGMFENAVKVLFVSKHVQIRTEHVYYMKNPYDLAELMMHIYAGLMKKGVSS